MKKLVLMMLLFVFASGVFGQRGYLGKRHVISTDIFSTYNHNKYNISYNYCLGKYIITKAAFSITNMNYLTDYTWEYLSHEIDDPVNELSIFNVESTNLQFNAHSWEIGFLFGSTGMPMPLGYYMGIAYEHSSGDITEDCKVRKYDYGPTPLFDKQIVFENKAGIIKLIYGRNAYLKYNFLLNVCLELGLYSGKNTLKTENIENTEPLMILPCNDPFKNISYTQDQIFIGTEKKRVNKFYIMPTISIGYVF